MDAPDMLDIAFQISDESKELVKLLVIGVRTNGSVLILDSGLTENDLNELYRDFRVWLGGKLGGEITAPPTT